MLTDEQLGQLYNLKRDRGSGWEKPYKPALLLALVDYIKSEHIRFDLIARYFPDYREALLRRVSSYHHIEKVADLSGVALAKTEDPSLAASDPVRSAAFARTIKEVYDYRCAASGLRFRMGDLTIVDACHLIPFAESGNDHPTNGIALSKNPASRTTPGRATGALDRHLITPFATETKLVWRTAPCLDDRLEGHKDLLQLEGRSVLLPKEKRFWPEDSGLQWRIERLRGIECIN